MKFINTLLVCDEESNAWSTKRMDFEGIQLSFEQREDLARMFEVIVQLACLNSDVRELVEE